jgi:thiamine biosynthesis protein ThiS
MDDAARPPRAGRPDGGPFVVISTNLRRRPQPLSRGGIMSAPLNLTVNGEPRRTTAATIAALVEELGLKPEKVAVERNGTIVPRSTLGSAPLADGDVLEIVHFVGGG